MIFLGIIGENVNANEALARDWDGRIQKCFSLKYKQIRQKNLLLYVSEQSSKHDKDVCISSDTAILLGRVFNKFTQKSLGSLELERSHRDISERLVQEYWGKYICISFNQTLNRTEVIRDPTGQLPFFYYKNSDGQIILSNEMVVLSKLLNQKLDYDWDYLSSYLLYGSTYSTLSPFKEVKELPPGCILTISGNSVNSKIAWTPSSNKESHCDANTFEEQFISNLLNSLKSWGSNYEEIVLSLSGGLDSSALLFVLKEAFKGSKKITAVNFFHPKVRSSIELNYARQVCKENDLELKEFDLSDALPCSCSKKLFYTPNKPSPSLAFVEQELLISSLLMKEKSSLFVSGHGGDHILMCPPPVASIVDCIKERGFSETWGKINELATYYRKPFASILINGSGSILKGGVFDKSKKNSLSQHTNAPWLTDYAKKRSPTDLLHPGIFDIPKHTLPGKREQIEAFYQAQQSIYLNTEDHTNPTFYPLMYQPSVETALSLPSYSLYGEGYDRLPFRRAISKHYSTNSVWRRSKGRTAGIVQLGVKKNLDYILELCLEGRFANQGLLDRDVLSSRIKLFAHGQKEFLWPLLNLISGEIFLKYWDEL